MTVATRATSIVAGVAGSPVRHSLSPLIHNAWLAAAGIDGVYVAFSPPPDRFPAFAEGLRGGAVRGVNVTAPFKHDALAIADKVSAAAGRAGAANLLLFETDGAILADNTDGAGLLWAFETQAAGFDPTAGPVAIFGAGGAARSAVAAFIAAGAGDVRLVNRSRPRAEALAAEFARTSVFDPAEAGAAMEGANAVINATGLGFGGGEGPTSSFVSAPGGAVVMDMVYRPLRTRFLERAAARGLRTVDGLAMLIGQAGPSFEAFFGRLPPRIDVRALARAGLEAAP